MTATFEEEVDRYHVELYRFAYCLTGSELVAEELTIQAFWNVRIESSNSKVSLFSEVHRNSNAFANDSGKGDARLREKSDNDRVVLALLELDALHRAAISLFYGTSCSVAEIGEILNLPQFMVRFRVAEGRERLRPPP